jgi:transketolase
MSGTMTRADAPTLRARARDARRLILQTVRIAQAGHVGGPMSACDLLSALYFHELRLDPARPDWPDRDRFVLSKGHCALALYAMLALRGFFPVAEMATFDRVDSRLQGHPDMTRLPGLDMSTGSLGMGLSAGVGMALGARLRGQDFRTFVMLGDGECQEGQVWEAAQAAARYGLDNLVAILDHNRLQQYGWKAGKTQQDPLEKPGPRFRAFGWHVIEIDGHDMDAILGALAEAKRVAGRPVIIVAATTKGMGVSFMMDDPDWHAKAPSEAQLKTALDELGGDLMLEPVAPDAFWHAAHRHPLPAVGETLRWTPVADGPALAHRDVFGKTLVALGAEYPELVVLDGDLANSTKADLFADAHPHRFMQMGIAEQNMVSVAAGLATVGLVPWISTFTAFVVKRAADQVRVQVAQTHASVRLVGSYSGLLTNRTGKSHQSIADLTLMRAVPDMVVVAPADGVEAEGAMRALQTYQGPSYLRLNREPARAIFDAGYRFEIGRGVVLREGKDLAIVSTGVQSGRALEAAERLAAEGIDVHVLHLPTVKPLDTAAIVAAAKATGRVLVTEEHTIVGGLGSAVTEVLAELHPVPVRRHGLPDAFAESGADADLLEKYGLTARQVAEAAKAWLTGGRQ